MRYFVLLSAFLISFYSVHSQTLSDGIKQFDIEQYSNAEKTFKGLVDAGPTAENVYYLGDFYLKTLFLDTLNKETNIELAKNYFLKGRNLDPKYALNIVGLGAVHYLLNNEDSAKVYFDLAIKNTKSKNAQVFQEIGEAYLYKGAKDVEKAIQNLEKAQSLDDKNTDIAISLGDAYLIFDKGNATRAKKQYDKALSINPKLAKAHIKGGKIYYQAKSYAEALKYYDKAIEVDPNYSPAYRERAELYYKFAAYRDRAPGEYKKYLDLSDGSFKTKFRYANFCFVVGSYEESYAMLKELLPQNPTNKNTLKLLGYNCYELGIKSKDTLVSKQLFQDGLGYLSKYFEAITDSNKFIKEDFDYYGRLLIKTGNDSLGSAYVLKGFLKDTSRYEILGTLANEFLNAKNYRRSAQFYDYYFDYKKPGANDYFIWGRSHLMAGNYAKADTLFSRLIDLKPDEILGHKYRLLTRSRMLDPEAKTGVLIPEHEKFIEFATAKDPVKYKADIINSYTYIGKYYLNAKKLDKSKEYWKMILALDPNDSNAKMVLSNLK